MMKYFHLLLPILLLISCSTSYQKRCEADLKVTGRIEYSGESPVCVENWQSRSKFTWTLTGNTKELKKQNMTPVVLAGEVVSRERWSGVFCVHHVEQVWSDGKTLSVTGLLVRKGDTLLLRQLVSPLSQLPRDYELVADHPLRNMENGTPLTVKGTLMWKNGEGTPKILVKEYKRPSE